MQKILYWSDSAEVCRESVLKMLEKYGHLEGQDLLRVFLKTEMPGQLALVSSFGTEAAVLLHMVAGIDPATPVIFIDTQKLFPETLKYRDALIEKLGLSNVRPISPQAVTLAQEDPTGSLWQFNPDQCCHIRKVLPLEKALESFDGWITGRKRAHGGARQNLPLIEISGGKLKLNPLAAWTMENIDTYFNEFDLPRHPLYAQGYLSVGCSVCTAKAACAENPREGRWAGTGKTECGIHFEGGKAQRASGS